MVVDIERGRTILKWRPHRLGGFSELRRSRSEEVVRKNKEEDNEREEEAKRRKPKKGIYIILSSPRGSKISKET